MKRAGEIEFLAGAREWAEEMFGGCELGDARRTRRVVEYMARQAANPSGSTNEVCQGDDAAAEGAYRLLRNDAIKPQALQEAPLRRTAERCAGRDTVLAIQDTAALAYSHSVAEELGDLGGGRGILVHSTLAVDGQTKEVLGLLDQRCWIRPDTEPGVKGRKKRRYEEKESYKWEAASQRIASRTHSMENIIQVCDREADIYEYLKSRTENGHRFIVRANHDRKLQTPDGPLWGFMAARRVIGHYELFIEQRGAQPAELGRCARPARRAHTIRIEVRSARVKLASPNNTDPPIVVNAVYVRQADAPAGENPLEWMLLTSEPVSTKRDALRVVESYESRWLIEEFHKAWKSGCRIEQRRLQSPANLERMLVLTAPVAVRLLQLRSLTNEDPERPCEAFLAEDEWKCLHATTHPNQPVPKLPPTCEWALRSIAKLGGWRDTKGTGKIGWMALWKGWQRFQERLAGWRAAVRSPYS
jgi:hypothetical protein